MTVFQEARSRNGNGHHPPVDQDWLTGSPMDPCAEVLDPLNPLSGFPFLHPGMAAIISGPTGKGRSSLIQPCAYDAGRAGLRIAYLGSEVTDPEFNARAALIAEKRGDDPVSVREDLANVRYLDLHSTLATAKRKPGRWIADAAGSFDAIIIDPLNDALAATRHGHENDDYITFYTTLIEPVRTLGAAVVMLDNVGHSEGAQDRPIGASAKGSKADLMFSCLAEDNPPMLRLKATKVRSVRAAFKKGTTWACPEDTLRLKSLGVFEAAAPPRSIADYLTDQLLALADRVYDDGGWSSLKLATAVGRANTDRSLQGALGRLVTDHNWTATGSTRNRLYCPADSFHSSDSLGDEKNEQSRDEGSS